ncbi:MAG: NAD(P)H-hydrate dehydratase [Oscillospiraceae bacterium]
MFLTSSALMRQADEAAIYGAGIPSIQLMESAAGYLARAAYGHASCGGTTYVFCGSGNNGGDGIGAAVYLVRHGCRVRVLLTGERERMSADSREMERRLVTLGVEVEEFDPDEKGLAERLEGAPVIIDAIFGIGLNKPVRGKAQDAIRMINASGAPVISADIPSGVEADTGRILGMAVKAERTVTFSLAKPGHFIQPGCTCCGRLEVRDIGIPVGLVQGCKTKVRAVLDGEVRLPARAPVSHKGDYGRLLIVGGCVGYTGAPNMCALAAVRSGAGLVHLGVPRSIYPICAVKNDEAMPFPLADDADGLLSAEAGEAIGEKLKQCGACVIGPGLGRSPDTVRLVQEVVKSAEMPLVVDADGLYALSGNMELLSRAPGTRILTPHDGEFVRMGGVLSGDRIADAASFAQEHNCVLVLKGHRTLVAFPDGEVSIITHGNPGMAKGGTGDVLAGIIGAMLGQFPLKEAVVNGVFLHALAGDMCRDELGEYSMTAGDIIRMLPKATMRLAKSGEERETKEKPAF